MKKQISFIIFMICILVYHQKVIAQATFANNLNGAPDFLGGNAASAKALDIGQSNPIAINFYTNGGAYVPGVGFLAAMHRMAIYDAGAGGLFNSGFVGIGNCNVFAPQSLFHQHLIGNTNVYHQFTNGNTGAGTGILGFKLGIRYDNPPVFDLNGPAAPWNIAELRQQDDAPMDFYSNEASNPATLPLRMRISYGMGCDRIGSGVANTPGVTKVMIGHMGTTASANPNEQFWPMNQGVAMLNIGENFIPGQSAPTDPYIGGARDWMDVGTYYNFDTDNMYVGLKDNGSNDKDAIISWGDDPSGGSTPSFNRLLFNFTSTGAGPNQAIANQGLEIGRMLSVDGNFGRMGIGGDPNIVPPNTYFGGSFDPTNTLEVNSPDGNALMTLGGNSGLRFSDLNSNSSMLVNPGPGVLAVNSSGDVVYVESIQCCQVLARLHERRLT